MTILKVSFHKLEVKEMVKLYDGWEPTPVYKIARSEIRDVIIKENPKVVMTGFSGTNKTLSDNASSAIINYGLSEGIVLSRKAEQVLKDICSAEGYTEYKVLAVDGVEPYDPGV